MEDSVNLVKGYGKINPTDAETTNAVTITSHSPSRSRRITAIVILTLSIFAVITAVITATTAIHRHRHHSSPPEPNQPPSLKSSESIKTVCAVTQHPDTCFTDVSSINSGDAVDPVTIFNLTLRLTFAELTNVSALPKTLISESNDLRTGSALRDCASLFDDAVSRLSESVEAMAGGGDELTEAKVADMMTWISAAMTDQQTCVDGLEEVGSTAVDEVKMKVQRSNEWMSNSLAILNNMESILGKFGLHLH
ncbi:pectinesterase 1-like [Bidens hawaiensis]|uniref:pectinesterase 1-like n=1 Tax=Bidens hawaiensis TaxID=980011 RepID=UPI00404A3499